MTVLSLGPVAFEGFELPEGVVLGGAQRLAVHRLPGGLRVIDAMGPDDVALSWRGVFAGPNAADRVRLMNTLRRVGGPLLLAWEAWAYTVIIASFVADSAHPYWIPYRVSCTVVRDEGAAIPDAPDPLVNDLAVAASYSANLTGVDGQLAAATAGLSGDFPSAISATGQMARLAAARGFVLRAGGLT